MNYIPNPFFEREFLTSQDAKDIVEEPGERIAERARAIAPVDKGEYRGSIKFEDGEVIADDDKAVFLEFGTGDTPTFAPLRRAAAEVLGADSLRRR
jgi:hypothetical protein